MSELSKSLLSIEITLFNTSARFYSAMSNFLLYWQYCFIVAQNLIILFPFSV